MQTITTFLASLCKAINPVARYGPCIGLTLYRWRRRKAELWYSPADYATPLHTHEHSSGEFWVLYGRGRTIFRDLPANIWDLALNVPVQGYYRQSYQLQWPQCLRRLLSVRAGTPHGFLKGTSPMIWICFETWLPGTRVTSVAEDFKLVPELQHELRNEHSN